MVRAIKVVMFGLVAASIGVAIGFNVAVDPRPDILDVDQTVDRSATWTLATSQFDDRRQLEYVLTPGQTTTLASPASGRITSLSCEGEVRSGEIPLAIDGRPLLALATIEPMWRDLAVGSRGADVEILETELVRLGAQGVTVDTQFTRATLAAVHDLMGNPQQLDRETVLSRSNVIWLPIVELTDLDCDEQLGSTVQAGDPLFHSIAKPLALTATSRPRDLYPGSRMLRIDDVEVKTNADFAVVSPTDLEAILGTQTVQFAQTNSEFSIVAQLALAEPVTVVSVPPTSIVLAEDSSTCVVGPMLELREVSVVASRAGQVLIAIDGAIPNEILIAPEVSVSSCGL